MRRIACFRNNIEEVIRVTVSTYKGDIGHSERRLTNNQHTACGNGKNDMQIAQLEEI